MSSRRKLHVYPWRRFRLFVAVLKLPWWRRLLTQPHTIAEVGILTCWIVQFCLTDTKLLVNNTNASLALYTFHFNLLKPIYAFPFLLQNLSFHFSSTLYGFCKTPCMALLLNISPSTHTNIQWCAEPSKNNLHKTNIWSARRSELKPQTPTESRVFSLTVWSRLTEFHNRFPCFGNLGLSGGLRAEA